MEAKVANKGKPIQESYKPFIAGEVDTYLALSGAINLVLRTQTRKLIVAQILSTLSVFTYLRSNGYVYDFWIYFWSCVASLLSIMIGLLFLDAFRNNKAVQSVLATISKLKNNPIVETIVQVTQPELRAIQETLAQLTEEKK